MSCWKCGSGQHLYEITRYPASRNQIAGVGGNSEEIVPLEDLSEADRKVVMRMSAESDDSKFYMVHEHKAKRAGLHFDLRLEHEGVLKSWAIPKGMPTSGRHLAIQTTDHSMKYGKWEGTIKSGYGAGDVKIDTSGRYETIQKSSSNWKFKILSGKYRGTWNLSHWKQDKWLITKVGDKKMSENFNAEDRPEEERMTRAEAETLAAKMINLLQPYADSIDVCGSYRRGREDPGDLDIVVILKPRVSLPEIVEDLEGEYTAVNWVGEKKTQMVIDGVKVDVRTTTPRAKGAALLYFTGPAGYNIGIRRSAKSRGMKLNEYGIFDRETNEYLGGATEEEIYEILGKNFRPATERRAEGKMSLAQRLQLQQPKRKGQDYSLLTQEQLIGVGGTRFNTREKRQAFIDYQKRKKARGRNLMSRAEGEEVVTRSLGEIPDDVLRYMYRRGDISKMQMEIGIGLKMQAEEVQEFNAMVKAPKGWNKAGITEKVMMREVMMQEARLQEALLELETNIRVGLISEKKAMAMFAKLLG